MTFLCGLASSANPLFLAHTKAARIVVADMGSARIWLPPLLAFILLTVMVELVIWFNAQSQEQRLHVQVHDTLLQTVQTIQATVLAMQTSLMTMRSAVLQAPDLGSLTKNWYAWFTSLRQCHLQRHVMGLLDVTGRYLSQLVPFPCSPVCHPPSSKALLATRSCPPH